MKFNATIDIHLQTSVLDPQGKAIEKALSQLDFDNLTNVRVGKQIRLDVESDSLQAARNNIGDACEKILVNPSVESYTIEMENESD